MRDLLLEKSANILKDTSIEPPSDATNGTFEVNIDPEHYRTIQEQLNSMTSGQGLLEILHQAVAASSNVSKGREDDEDDKQLKGSANDESTAQTVETNREKLLKKKERAIPLPEVEGIDEELPEGEVIGMVKNKGKVRSIPWYRLIYC